MVERRIELGQHGLVSSALNLNLIKITEDEGIGTTLGPAVKGYYHSNVGLGTVPCSRVVNHSWPLAIFHTISRNGHPKFCDCIKLGSIKGQSNLILLDD